MWPSICICKNENNADSFSGSSALFVPSDLGAINGTLLELGDNVADTILSKFAAISASLMSAIVYVGLLLLLQFGVALRTLPENILVFDMGITSLAFEFD